MLHDVAVPEVANLHDRSDDVLCVRIVNQSFKNKQRSRHDAVVPDSDLKVFFVIFITCFLPECKNLFENGGLDLNQVQVTGQRVFYV